MSRPRISRIVVLAAALPIAAAVAGCSEHYFDRRDTVALNSGDGIAVNRVTHMVDPWPPYSAQRDLTYDGHRAQMASERYRTDNVKPPVNITTSSARYQQQSANPPALNAAATSNVGKP